MSNFTPFEAVHEKLGACFGDYFGWKMPLNFGDEAAERAAIYNASAAIDLSCFGRIRVRGAGAVAAIDKLIATNTAKLSEGGWIWAVVCSNEGAVVDVVRVVCNKSDDYLVLTSPAKRQMVLELAEKCVGDDVKVEAITEKTGMLALYGPGAVEAVSRILPFDIADLEIGGATTISFFMMPITIIRGSWVGCDGLELICPKGAAGMAGAAIAKYREKEGIVPAGTDCLEGAMIEAGLPVSITNSPKGCKLTPQTLGLMGLVDLDKDFAGKEAIAQTAKKGVLSQIMGVKAGIGATHRDLQIQFDDGQIGWCAKMVPSEKLGGNVGLAVINSEFADIEDEVQVVCDGMIAGGELVKLPFGGGEPILPFV